MRKTRIKKTFDFKKLSRRLSPLVISNINIMGNRINKAIQDGIESGRDIRGNAFEKLHPPTIALGGKKPLKRTGNMSKTTKTPATVSKPQFTIEMVGKSKKGKVYGAYHNTGYVNSPDAWFPGAKVAKREWFGISKSMQPGGDELKKAFLQISMGIKMAWKKF